MLIDDLRQDIKNALTVYLRNSISISKLSRDRQLDLMIIRNILKEADALTIVQQLTKYLDQITLPWISFLTFLDINYFISLINGVLKHEKYQLLNMMKVLLAEKEKSICDQRLQHLIIQHKDLEVLEINLLKNENKYLYQTLAQLEEKIVSLEADKSNLTTRAFKAEQEIKRLINEVSLNSKSGQLLLTVKDIAPNSASHFAV